MSGMRSRPLELLDRLKTKAPRDYRQLFSRLVRTVEYGPRGYKWFKVIEDADGLVQIRSDNYRLLLFPHPSQRRVLIIAHGFKKASDSADHHHIEQGRQTRKRYLSILQSEESR